MKVLVAYASRHGSTTGIAERVASTLREAGHEVDLEQSKAVRSVDGYDAFVIGGCAYLFHWASPSIDLVRRKAATLRTRPTWLFTSGPLGTDEVDAKGRDVRVVSTPKELAELAELVGARGTEVFFGAWDSAASPVGVMERLMRVLPAAKNGMPVGDFRDWPAIEAWARGIAAELHATAPRTPVGVA